jgi:hypothetical protein
MDPSQKRVTIDFDPVARRIVELTDVRLIRERLMLVWTRAVRPTS